MRNAHIIKLFQPSDNVCVQWDVAIWVVSCVVIVMRTIATSIGSKWVITRKMYEKLENLLQLVHYIV